MTNFLTYGGTLEKFQQIANHAFAGPQWLYERKDDKPTLDEIERVVFWPLAIRVHLPRYDVTSEPATDPLRTRAWST